MNEATVVATSSPSMPWRSLMPWAISLAVMAVLPFLFDGGTAFTLLEVTEAQRALTDARSRRIELLRRFHLDGARLDRLSDSHVSLLSNTEHKP